MDATFRARLRVPPLVIAALFGFASCASAESGNDAASLSQTPTELPETVQQPLAEALDSWMDRYEVPGAAVTVTTPDGTWSAVRGVTDLETQDPITDDMVWPLRSVTKSVVVTVLLQLVEEGKLSLDDTIGTYIDDVPNGDQITLRQLANMTSGVGDYTRSESFVHTLVENPAQRFTLEALNSYGLAIGPLLLGFLISTTGYTGLYLVAAVILLLNLIVYWGVHGRGVGRQIPNERPTEF